VGREKQFTSSGDCTAVGVAILIKSKERSISLTRKYFFNETAY